MKKEDSKVTVNVVSKPKKKVVEQTDNDMKKIIENPMTPTAPPKKSSHSGAQDHIADKETKVSTTAPRPKAADPGQLGQDLQTKKAAKAQLQTGKPITMTPEKAQKNERKVTSSLLSPDGTVIMPGSEPRKPRNGYEALLPNSKDMREQVAAGYQDYVDEDVEIGERVDLDTTNFRFIGYFTQFRKAFELVWVYPSEAIRRGLQGEVKLEFTILKDGKVARIKLLATSGHKILDDAVIEAIGLASPYAPLPAGMKKDRLTIVGSFRYQLTSYAGAF